MTKVTGFTKVPSTGFRKVKPGYDQAFTLPKGTSAAPIKQATSYKPKMKLSKVDAFLAGTAVGVGATKVKKSKKSQPSKGLNKRPSGGWKP